jgi:hypothetical protein
MNGRTSIIVLSSLALGLAGLESALARGGGGGGGGMRGGGGGMRGGGGMHSSPSVSRPATSRPSSSAPRSDVQRPASSGLDRPARADVSPTSRDIGTSARPVNSSSASLPGHGVAVSTATPHNYGSVARPAAVGMAAAAGVAAGAAIAANPGLHSRNVPVGSPHQGGGVAISGPRGSFGAIHGPGGQTAVVHGPRGNTMVHNIPGGCQAVYWGGHSYWHHDYYWYAPVWHDDDWYWEYRYPPVGYWYPALPPGYETVVIDDATFYSDDAMYFQEGTQDGQDGYVVVPPPATNSAGEALAVLQHACDFLGSVTSFTAEVDLDMDRYLQGGDKVPVSLHCVVRVHQPDRLAVEYKGASDDRKVVYDGKNVTAVDRLKSKFTIVGAQPRLEDAIPGVKAKQSIIMPFSDLLQRDAFDTLSTAMRTAEYVGIRKVGNVECHQLAFTQDNVDWQLWVQTGDQPLPMKSLIQYKKDSKTPRYSWEARKWEINQPQPDDAFTVDKASAAAHPAPG